MSDYLSEGLEDRSREGLEERSTEGIVESVRLSSSAIILAMLGDEYERFMLELLDEEWSLSWRNGVL